MKVPVQLMMTIVMIDVASQVRKKIHFISIINAQNIRLLLLHSVSHMSLQQSLPNISQHHGKGEGSSDLLPRENIELKLQVGVGNFWLYSKCVLSKQVKCNVEYANKKMP